MKGTSKDADKSRRSLLKELPYFSCRGDLSMIHGQFNNSFVIPWKTRRDLDRLSSVYDLDLFIVNTIDLLKRDWSSYSHDFVFSLNLLRNSHS